METCHGQIPPPFPDYKNTREKATCSWDDREEGKNTGVPIENYIFAMDLGSPAKIQKLQGQNVTNIISIKKNKIHAAHRDRRCPKSRYAALRPALRPPVAVRDTHFLPATVCRGVTSPSIAPALRIHPSLLPLSLALSLLPSLPPSLAQRHPSELTVPPHTIDFPSTYSARQRATARCWLECSHAHAHAHAHAAVYACANEHRNAATCTARAHRPGQPAGRILVPGGDATGPCHPAARKPKVSANECAGTNSQTGAHCTYTMPSSALLRLRHLYLCTIF